MKYEIIHLNGFMYAVDKEADLKPDQHWIHPKGVIFPFTDVYYKAFTALKEYGKTGVIVATNDPSLNLPLLPVVEEESYVIRELADKILDKYLPHYYYTPVYPKNSQSIHDDDCERCRYDDRVISAMEEIYRVAASAKQFTEEDMRKAIELAREIKDGKDVFELEGILGLTEICTHNMNVLSADKIIQSLRPKPIAVELELVNQQKTINYHKDLWVDNYVPAVDENNFVKVKQWLYE